jgi:glycosyltransferase involved in cell wall biosynthesis
MITVRVQNLANYPRRWGNYVLPPYNSKAQGWGLLPLETAISLRKVKEPTYFVPPIDPSLLEALEAPMEDAPAAAKVEEFKAAVAQSLYPPYIILSPVPWGHTGQGQTPTEIAKGLAEQGRDVLYAYVGKAPASDSYPSPATLQVCPLGSTTEVCGPDRSHVSEAMVAGWVDRLKAAYPDRKGYVLVTAPIPSLCKLSEELSASLGWTVVYYCLDNWGDNNEGVCKSWVKVERGGETFAEEELHLIDGGAAKVIATSTMLEEKVRRALQVVNRDPETHLVLIGNGYDPTHFPPDGKPSKPSDMVQGTQGTVVYWGHLRGSWFNWDLVLHACEELPDVEFNLVGNCPNAETWEAFFVAHPQVKKDNLPSNLHLLGFKDNRTLVRYGANADVGIVPFKKGPIAEAVNPIKAYEYLACGIPVVSHQVPDTKEFPGVLYTAAKKTFVAKLKSAIFSGLTEDEQAEVTAFLSTRTWGHRASCVIGFLEA